MLAPAAVTRSRGQALVEFALSAPLLLLLLFGGLDTGIMLDNVVVGASAVREGARIAAIIGDGSHQTAQPQGGPIPGPMAQVEVDAQVVAAVVQTARNIPFATLEEVDIYRIPPDDPNSDGSFEPDRPPWNTWVWDRWRPCGASWCPDFGQQTFLLTLRPPDKAQIGVQLRWTYNPPGQSSLHYRLHDHAVGRAVPWFTPGVAAAPPLYISRTGCPTPPKCVHASFYAKANPLSGAFDTQGPIGRPVWTQDFEVIDFNPPAGAAIGCGHTGVDDRTRPFADIRPLVCLPPEPAQNADGTIKAGSPCPPDQQFPCTFAATFVTVIHLEQGQVPADGNIDFHMYSDDGWILGLGRGPSGGQPVYVRGSLVRAPSFTYERGYSVVGAYNDNSSPALNTVTVNFPGPGDYPMEIDYTETYAGQMALVAGTQFGDPIPEAP